MQKEILMKELTVFYCPHCGYYGYYLIPRRAVCPSCRIHMTKLPMSCQQFMDLDYRMRDQLIGSQILKQQLFKYANIYSPVGL